jgi:methyl-accepting chemotaxis protein
MNALNRLREKASFGIVGLLWIDLLLIVTRSFFAADGFDILSVAAAAIAVGLATFRWFRSRAGSTTRLVTSMAHALSVAILVYLFSGSSLQIDIHMYFFASLAICAAWIDWRPIVAYTALVAVHHVLLFLVMPAAVFPGDNDFARVVLHAVVLITQSGALIALTSAMVSAFAIADRSVEEAQAAGHQASQMAERIKLADVSAAEERQEREKVMAQAHSAVTFAVNCLRTALGRLSGGDVTVRIRDEMEGDLNNLRQAFNSSVEQLEVVLQQVGDVVVSVKQGSRQITDANADLSRRTERQVASVTHTASSLAEVLVTVRDTSALAENVGNMVDQARANAEKSGTVVTHAVDAMRKIESSSQEIGQIISVIDEIAFQTNLLALNAGVEAARAGDAGKGFAVVAQEVRELAQRSASAAKEIKGLVNTSAEHVNNGVKLVGKTGEALRSIAAEVADISGHVANIVMGSRKQTESLNEIGTAISGIDRDTQCNATMVDAFTSAIHTVAEDTRALEELIARFQVSTPQDRTIRTSRAA